MPFKIIKGDITKIKADCIVNTANPGPFIGEGVDSAIYKAAGVEELYEARFHIGNIPRGDCAITPAFNLDAKYIIHTVGPKWGDITEELNKEVLKSCYRKSLALAEENGCKSIAFPLISTGTYRFPKGLGVDMATESISDYLLDSEMMVYLVVHEKRNLDFTDEFLKDINFYINSQLTDSKLHPGTYAKLKDESKKMMKGAAKSVPVAEAMPMAEVADYSAANVVYSERISLDDLDKYLGETFQQRLERFIKRSGMKNSQVYHRANLTKQTFSKIKQDGYTPRKETIFALALALHLNIDDTKDLLESAGRSFQPSNRVDLIVQYCLDHEIYNVVKVDTILWDLTETTLIKY